MDYLIFLSTMIRYIGSLWKYPVSTNNIIIITCGAVLIELNRWIHFELVGTCIWR